MTEYIEKEAARPDEFCVGVSCQECPFLKDPIYGGCRVDDFIMALPPADVRPVVHGKWIKLDMHKGMEQYKCSVCRSECYVPECMGEPMYCYCPNCGATMGESDG